MRLRRGTVTEVNGELATAPEKINKEANKTWMVKVTLKNPAELNEPAFGRRLREVRERRERALAEISVPS